MAWMGYWAFCTTCVYGGKKTGALSQEHNLSDRYTELRKFLAVRREPCTRCGLPVFLAERLLVGRRLFHRPCFRCARCQHVLSLANFYETEDGNFCCETCPDEVGVGGGEEKEQSVPQVEDAYSAACESVLEEPGPTGDQSLGTPPAPARDAAARSHFMSGLMVASDARSSINSLELSATDVNKDIQSCTLSSSEIEIKPNIHSSESNKTSESFGNSESPSKLDFSDRKLSDSFRLQMKRSSSTEENIQITNSLKTGGDIDNDVPLKSSITKHNNSDSQHFTANSIPKDEYSDRNKPEDLSTKDSDLSAPSAKSIVKMRLRMFENSGTTGSTDKTKVSKTNANRKCALYQRAADNDAQSKIVGDLETSKSSVNSSESNDFSVCSSNIVDKSILQEKRDTFQSNTNTEVSIEKLGESVGLKEESLLMCSELPEEIKCEDDLSSKKSSFDDKEEAVEAKNELLIAQTGDKTADSIVGDMGVEDPLEDIFVDEIEEKSPLENSATTSLQYERVTEFSELLSENECEENYEPVIVPRFTIESKVKQNQNELSSDNEKSVVEKSDLSVTNISPKDVPSQEPSSRKASVVTEEATYPEELNPFGDDDDDNNSQKSPEPAVRVNPFSSCEEEEEDEAKKSLHSAKPPRPPLPSLHKTLPSPRRLLEAPRVSLNPFWSDGEEPSSDEESQGPPVPLPRTIKPTTASTPEPSPRPRKALGSKFGSGTSLNSVSSPGGSTAHRKKKPAPPPPSARDLFPAPTSSNSSRASSPTLSMGTPQHRKARPAPPPPVAPDKNEKDVANRSRQSQGPLPTVPNKSTFGQWKRKKGPAPPRPVPQRRQVTAMPMQEVRRELEDIEVQQQELERQGVTLEQTIRSKFDNDPNINQDDTSMTPDVEDLVLQLFELVNEKNELFRRQAELMYLRRQQRLEEEHADLEYQIRCLLLRPEHSKSESDRAREEELIQRLVEVVERRNEIVECLEMDRRREAEEDRSIHKQLGIFAAKGKGTEDKIEDISPKSVSKSAKKDKKSKKNKEKHSAKKGSKSSVDVDKDIDEMESLTEQVKEKKSKKKWFL